MKSKYVNGVWLTAAPVTKLLDETDRRICHRARKELRRIGTEEGLAAVEEWERQRG